MDVDELGDEFEALAAIYEEGFRQISPLSVSVTLVPSSGDDDDEHHVSLELMLEFDETSSYPEELPKISLTSVLGDLDSKIESIIDALDVHVTENDLLGMPLCYSLCEFVQDWLTENNFPADDSMYSQMSKRANKRSLEQQAAIDLAERAEALEVAKAKRRAEGTPCTPASFAAWNASYLAELAAAKIAARPATTGKTKTVDVGERLTGRQLFEKGVVVDAPEPVGSVEVDANLFADDGDVPDEFSSDDDDE